jgi:hypothetical protein
MNAVDNVSDVAALSAESIGDSASQAINSGERQTDKAIKAGTAAMKANANLITTTALGGQDLMIDLVKKVLLGTVIAGGVAATTYAIKGDKK